MMKRKCIRGSVYYMRAVLDVLKGGEYTTTAPGPATGVGIQAELKVVSELFHFF